MAHLLPCNDAAISLNLQPKGCSERAKLKKDSTQSIKRYQNSGLADALGDLECQKVLAHLGVGVIVVNRSGTIRFCNPKVEEITGINATAVIGRQFNRAFDDVLTGTVPLNFFALRSMAENTDFEITNYAIGGERRDLSVRMTKLQDSSGQISAYVLTLQDLTRLRQDAQEAQRGKGLAIVGDVAARMAHEIRNPLGSIELFATSIGADPEISPEIQALTSHISTSVESINTIIENLLLAVNSNQKPDFEDIDLHEALQDSLFFAGHLLSSNKSLRVNACFSQTPLRVWGDPQLLKQVMLNLILNAIQAMPQGGELTISSHPRQDNSTARDFAEVRVTDTGVGIAEADLGRVFDPYYTTKENGTGLGLAIVHNIIRAHGGTIAIVSEQRQGTECIIRLPIIKERDKADKLNEALHGLWLLNPKLRKHHARTVHTSC